MSKPQNYKNHVRFDPLWHFFAAPFLLVNFIFWIVITVHHWPQHRVPLCWLDLLSIVLVVYIGVARAQTLRVQDRIIRLEEQLRYARLLPPEILARSGKLTLRQTIGLRFASNEELPALLERALNETLTEKQIKQAVVAWRADNYRA